ncbi:MAG: GYD domain-containing protein [Chloroflexota bacterium]|nr:GYD domain-containing protein [Chloroflexota bacterium]
MAKYVVLINWTDQGVQSVTDSPQRAEQAAQMIERLGGHMDTILWTLGRYDLVAFFEAPDEATAAAIGLRTAQTGATRTEILRAFDAEEMARILQKLG